MGAHVVADALAEVVGADVLLEHAHDRRTLFVRQDVVHAFGIGRGLDFVFDRAGAVQRVDVVGGGAVEGEALPDLPVGAVGVGGRRFHERGEGFLEPQAFPPLHGDEVAEPHVGELVGDHGNRTLLFRLGGLVFVDEEQNFAERDGAGVLHSAEREVGDRQHVDLVAEVRHAEVVRQPAQTEHGGIERERDLVASAGPVHDAHGHAIDVDRVGGFELAHAERQQVRRHQRGRGVGDLNEAVAQVRAAGLGHRRDGKQVVGDFEGDFEHGLVGGLVPAGEAASSVGRLELGGGDRVLGAVVVGEAAAVEASELVVEDAVEGDVDREVARGDRFVDGERESLRCFVECNRGGLLGVALAHDC